MPKQAGTTDVVGKRKRSKRQAPHTEDLPEEPQDFYIIEYARKSRMGDSFEKDIDEDDVDEERKRAKIKESALRLGGSWIDKDALGRALVFKTLEAANKLAAEKWKGIQGDHLISGWDVPSGEDDDDYDFEQFCTYSKDGRACYERDQRCNVEMNYNGVMHEAFRTTTLEVLPVSLEG